MKYGKRDVTHKNVVLAARNVGASVLDLGDVAGGVPDILVGYRGRMFLVEIKTGNAKPRANQVAWHEAWRGGSVLVWRSADDVVSFIAQFNEQETAADR